MFSSRFFRTATQLISKLRIRKSEKSSLPAFIRAGVLATGVAVYSFSNVMCNTDHIKEFPAGSADDIPEGSIRRIQIGDNEENFIIVSRVDGQFYATGGKCAHYGAPLQMGFLDGYAVICPWHGAAFDVRSGEHLHAPSFNAIPTYKIHKREGELFVEIPESKLNSVAGSHPSKKLGKRDPANNETFVVVGGGAAGGAAVETFRREGFTGRLILLTEESQTPYDRVPLSKNFKMDSSKLSFRSLDFYAEHDIEVHTEAQVKSVNQVKKVVTLSNGNEVSYDKLLLATGSRAKVPGFYRNYTSNYKNVLTLRGAADHTKAKGAISTANNVVIIGAGFIGLEVAKGIKTGWPEKNVTVIAVEEKPFAPILGSEIAAQLVDSHKLNGVNVITGQKIESLEGKDGLVHTIVLPSRIAFGASPTKLEIPTDLVILATGADLNTSFAPPSLLNSDGSVRVNSHFQTEDTSIYAAGDIAQFLSLLTESRERVEHWSVAEQQGRSAALNMIGRGGNYLDVPFFWSNQFINVNFAGFSTGHDWTYTETKGEDVPSKASRITYFYKGERCIGVAAVNWPGAVLRLKIALQRGLMPSRRELTEKTVGFQVIADKVKNSNPCGANCCRR